LSLLGERFTSLGLVHLLVLLRAKISIPAANCRRILSNLYFRSDKNLNQIGKIELAFLTQKGKIETQFLPDGLILL